MREELALTQFYPFQMALRIQNNICCHLYDIKRRDLLESVNAKLLENGLSCLSKDALVQVISYRDERLTNDIIKATLKYTHTSYRFLKSCFCPFVNYVVC